MYKVKNLSEIPRKAKLEHLYAYILEFSMVLVSLGFLIYNAIIGDPDNRILACLGSVLCFLLPFLIELVFKRRFSLLAHILADAYMIFTVFLGSALNFFKTVGPYDEIGHFLFGYFCCILFFYIFLSWNGSKKLSKGMSAFAIFMLSMAIAPLWEITEFCADLFLHQDSMGYVTEEFIAEAQSLGLTGFDYAVYKLMNGVSVWDTITDMTLHFFGSILFVIQYVIYRNTKKTFMLRAIENDYYKNKKIFYTQIEDPIELSPQNITEVDHNNGESA